MKPNHSIFILLSVFIVNSIIAQEKVFLREFPKLNREVNQSIYDMYVDDKGLLFLGTSLGLFSFNGVEVKPYSFKSNLSFSVDNILQSDDGRVWCKNFSNEIFYLERDTLYKDQALNNYVLTKNSYLLDFKFIDGMTYLLLENQFFKYDYKKKEITEIYSLNSEEKIFHSFDYNSKLSEFYLSTSDGLITLKDNQIIQKAETDGKTRIVHRYGEDLFSINTKTSEVKKNNQLIFTPKGDNRIVFFRFSEQNSELWLTSSAGLFKYNPENNSIEKFDIHLTGVTDIVTDLEGNHWVSSLDKGVFFIPNMNLKLIENSSEANLLSSQNYSTLISNLKNEFYAGTSNGKVFKFDINNKLSMVLDTKTNLEIEYVFEDDNRLITSRGIFDLDSNQFTESYIGKSIAKDNVGNYLISTYNLAGILNTDFSGSPNQFTTNLIDFGNLNTQINVLRNKRARASLFSHHSNQYYVGYSDGLYVYDGVLNTKEIKYNQKEIIAVSMIEDVENQLWIATNRKGVLLAKNDQIIDSISTKDGLSNNKTKSVKIHDQRVWILTETNLDYYDLVLNKVVSIGDRLGLNGLILNDILILNEYLYVATNKGILYIKLIDLEKPFQPYFNISVTGENYRTAENLMFNYNESINIQLEAIYYKAFGNFSFNYKLKPIHKEWQTQKAQNNELNFYTLPAGNYEVIAEINDKNILPTEQRIQFQINKPFWQKWWFTAILTLFFLLIIVLIYKFAVYRTQKRQNLKEELATSQLTALRSQMNPHFIFNVLNSIQGLMYSNQKGKANDYMGKFSELMRNILDNSEKRYIALEDEIYTLKLYIELEKSRFEDKNFRYSLLVDKGLDPSEIQIPSMILQPFVENAIKHGLMHKRGQKLLEVNFRQKNPSILSVEIKDNGVGIKLASEINEKIKKHKSFATNAINKRISLMNKLSESLISIKVTDLTTDKTHSLGTLISIDFPIRHKSL